MDGSSWAAEKGHEEVVRLLVEAGASAALQDRKGQTALALAEQGGHAEVAARLR